MRGRNSIILTDVSSLHIAHLETPIGWLEVRGGPEGVAAVHFAQDAVRRGDTGRPLPAAVSSCLDQLEEYFRGTRRRFSVELDLRGTEFQKRVWRLLLEIPFGETASYQQIASAAGNAKATRAVGGANHRNPVSIIVPCHRVVGADGRLTGYGGGLWRKEWLLDHEKRIAGRF